MRPNKSLERTREGKSAKLKRQRACRSAQPLERMTRRLNIIAFGIAIAVTACSTPHVHTAYPLTSFSFQSLSDDALHDPVIVGFLESAQFKETSSKSEPAWSSRTLRIDAGSPNVTLTLVDRWSRPKCIRVVVAPTGGNTSEAEKLAVSIRTYVESRVTHEVHVYPSADCVSDS
jgi:hypothetical protein